MSKKKKKIKEGAFTKDYSKTTRDDQLILNALASSIMDSEYCVSVDDNISTEEIDQSTTGTRIIKMVPNTFTNGCLTKDSNKVNDPETHDDLESFLAKASIGAENFGNFARDIDLPDDIVEVNMPPEDQDGIRDDLVPVVKDRTKEYHSLEEVLISRDGEDEDEETEEQSEDTEEQTPDIMPKMGVYPDGILPDEKLSERQDEVANNPSSITLQDAFKMIVCDDENGDFIISDPYKNYKAHTINTYALTEARTNYASSSVYNGMVKNIPFALAFIAGPILVIRPGDELFQKFITTVETFDRDHIFIMTRVEDTKGPDGNDVIDFLVYYADPESVEFTIDLIRDFQGEPDSAIDFLYAVFKKAMDRHENLWSSMEWIDNIIEIEKSQAADVYYAMDLITNDGSTVIDIDRNRTVEEFIKEFTRPIENYIDPEKGIFTKNCKMLKALLDDKMAPTDKEGVLIIPENFSFTKNMTKNTQGSQHPSFTRSNESRAKTVYSSGSMDNKPFKAALQNVIMDEKAKEDPSNIEIEDAGDGSEIEIKLNERTEEVKENPNEEFVMHRSQNSIINPAQEAAMPEPKTGTEASSQNTSKDQDEVRNKNMKVFGKQMSVRLN